MCVFASVCAAHILRVCVCVCTLCKVLWMRGVGRYIITSAKIVTESPYNHLFPLQRATATCRRAKSRCAAAPPGGSNDVCDAARFHSAVPLPPPRPTTPRILYSCMRVADTAPPRRASISSAFIILISRFSERLHYVRQIRGYAPRLAVEDDNHNTGWGAICGR